jgi:hypothetical protein
MASYESIYGGVNSYLVPSYTNLNYSTPLKSFSITTVANSANQLREVSNKLNTGAENIEVQGLFAKSWEAIPEQHLTEINRLAKLTGMKPSVHGILVEPSGISGQQQKWSETNRETVERQMADMIKRAQKIDPNGGLVVTFHSAAEIPEMIPKVKVIENGKEVEKTLGFSVLNTETGQYGTILPEKKYFSEEGKFTGQVIPFDIDTELNTRNKETWTQKLAGISRYAINGDEAIKKLYLKEEEGQIVEKTPEEVKALNKVLSAKQEEIDAIKDVTDKNVIENLQRQMNQGQIYLKESYREIKELFDRAYEKSEGEDRKKLTDFATWAAPMVEGGIGNDPEKVRKLSEVVQRGLKTLDSVEHPALFQKLDKFVLDKSSQTFANVATQAFNAFGNKAPIISIENPPAGTGLSKAEDLRNLVEESRKKFAENLVKQKGMSESESKAVAERLIGATWDVGHINMIRGQGYSDKDVVKQTEIIAPFVKHVHLSDNFGFEHTELPMGMGNVPIKEMMKKIGDLSPNKDIKSVIETGDYYQHFVSQGEPHPLKPTLEAFNSPIYGVEAAPSWGNIGGYPGYFSGYGATNPAVHHSIYGAGFTNLPVELGGEIAGAQSRFSGTPTA